MKAVSLSLRKVIFAFALVLAMVLPFCLAIPAQGATSVPTERTSELKDGGVYSIVGHSLADSDDTSAHSYAVIGAEKSIGLDYAEFSDNPGNEFLWKFTYEGNNKWAIYSLSAQKYMSISGSTASLSSTKTTVTVSLEQGAVILSQGNYYLRFTTRGTMDTADDDCWHSGTGTVSRYFHLYSMDDVNASYAETGSPVMRIACFADMHHEYGVQYTSTTTRASSVTAYNYVKNTLCGADVVLIGGDVTGRRANYTGSNSTWSNNGAGDDGSKVISNMMKLNYQAFQSASKTGKVLVITGNHDPEPSVHMSPVGDATYPAANSNDWMSYMTSAVGNAAATVTYSDLGLSTADIPTQYQNEVLGYRYEINGMIFLGLNTPFGDRISVSQVGSNGLYVKQVEWARQQLAAIGKDKTVMLMCHYPTTGLPTVSGATSKVVSGNSSAAQTAMISLLKDYPNVIYLYGHVHQYDSQTVKAATSEKVNLTSSSVRLKNNAYLTDGYIYAYMGSLGYYSTTANPGLLTQANPKVVQFLIIDVYANHITFKYYNTGEQNATGGTKEIASFTVMRDLSSQLGVASVAYDATPEGTVYVGDIADLIDPDDSGSGNSGSSGSGGSGSSGNSGSGSSGGSTGSTSTGSSGTGSSSGSGSNSDSSVSQGDDSMGSGSGGGSVSSDSGSSGAIPDDGDDDYVPDDTGSSEEEESTFVPPVIDTEVNATKPSENALNANIAGSANELKQAVLADYELEWAADGYGVQIYLTAKDISDQISDGENSLVQKQIGDGTVGAWLGLELYSQMEGEDEVHVTETNAKITVTVTVPDTLKNTSAEFKRTYSVLQITDETVTVLPSKYDAATGTLTFETDNFTSVAVAYADVAVPSTDTQTDASSDGGTDGVTDVPTDGSSDVSATTDAPAVTDSSNSSDSNGQEKSGLPVGAIIGIVAGAVVILGGGGFCLWYFVLRKKPSVLAEK